MKKFFTLLMAAMSCMAASAKDYTDQLTVNFGGATTSTNMRDRQLPAVACSIRKARLRYLFMAHP